MTPSKNTPARGPKLEPNLAAGLNFKHLRYFWAVAKMGSIARAAQFLHLMPHSISSQLAQLEHQLGAQLLRKVGRNLEPTELGLSVMPLVDEIFSSADALTQALRVGPHAQYRPFRVGIVDSVPKSAAQQLLEPALRLEDPVRLICREGRLAGLLAELAVHKIDLVIADQTLPSGLNVRAYTHLLGESALSIFGTAQLSQRFPGTFPGWLNKAPFLLPGVDFAVRKRLSLWFESVAVQPKICGEFDDSALMKAFAQAGAGFFAAPSAISRQICSQYGLQELGHIESVRLQLYAITPERRMSHPAAIAIRQAAQDQGWSEKAEARPI